MVCSQALVLLYAIPLCFYASSSDWVWPSSSSLLCYPCDLFWRVDCMIIFMMPSCYSFVVSPLSKLSAAGNLIIGVGSKEHDVAWCIITLFLFKMTVYSFDPSSSAWIISIVWLMGFLGHILVLVDVWGPFSWDGQTSSSFGFSTYPGMIVISLVTNTHKKKHAPSKMAQETCQLTEHLQYSSDKHPERPLPLGSWFPVCCLSQSNSQQP